MRPWVATGKLIDFEMGKLGSHLSKLTATMHTGWMGSGHKVTLVFDKKFSEQIMGELKLVEDKREDRLSNYRFKGTAKPLPGHTIEIIIK